MQSLWENLNKVVTTITEFLVISGMHFVQVNIIDFPLADLIDL